MAIAIKLGCEGSLGILPEFQKRKRKLFALLQGDGVELICTTTPHISSEFRYVPKVRNSSTGVAFEVFFIS